MRQAGAAFVILLAFNAVNAQEENGHSHEAYALEALAKFQANRDELVNMGYACMAVGASYIPPDLEHDRDGRVSPTLLLTAKRGDQKVFVYSRKTLAEPAMPYVQPQTRWCYEVFSDNQVKLLAHERSMPTVMKLAKYLKRSNPHNLHVPKHDPFDDWLSPGEITYQRLTNDRIRRFFVEMELQQAKDLGSGKTEVIFQKRYPDKTQQFRIVFSKAHGDMPVEMEITTPESTIKILKKNLMRGKYEWTKNGQRWLPRRVQSAMTVFSGANARVNEVDLHLEWKVGDEVPKSVFDLETKDPRDPLGELFGFDYDRFAGGKVFAFAESPWELPEVFAQ